MKNNIIQIITAVVFLALLLLLTDPFMLFMPPMAAMLALLAVVVIMCMWSGFILYEQFADERELMHRMYAGRIAYLTALACLTLSVLVEALSTHHIDPWITLTLALMVISKLGARIYFDHFK